MKNFTALSLIVFSLMSCSTHNTPVRVGTDTGFVRSSIVTTKYTDYLLKNATFRWAPNLIKFYDDERLKDAGFHDLLRNSILNELGRHGFKFEPESAETNYIVGYVAALESALDDGNVQKLYGIQPGLTGNRYDTLDREKGTVIIDIVDTKTGRMLWRGAGQAFASLDEIPQELRKKRIEYFLKEIFSDLPLD